MTDDRPTCYRCNTALTNTHQIHLTSTHEGDDTGHYQDVDRRVCLDCLAAIGMLELNKQPAQDEASKAPLQSRFSPVRSLRGSD